MTSATRPAIQTDPLNTQVGGQHYMQLGIDPNTFAMKNRWDPCAYNILRYLSRHRAVAMEKGPEKALESVRKAHHYVFIRHALLDDNSLLWRRPKISMEDYLLRNSKHIPAGADRAALQALDRWVTTDNGHAQEDLIRYIEDLEKEYGVNVGHDGGSTAIVASEGNQVCQAPQQGGVVQPTPGPEPSPSEADAAAAHVHGA